MKKYCGNNEIELQTGMREGKYGGLGTRSECLRIGFGRALSSPVKQEYSLPYAPIEEDNFYCGDLNDLPEGYDRFGTRPQCLSRGFGIGSSKKAKSRRKTRSRRKTKSRKIKLRSHGVKRKSKKKSKKKSRNRSSRSIRRRSRQKTRRRSRSV